VSLGEHDPARARHVVPGDDAVGEGLGVPGDAGQRSAQLVRHRQQELPLTVLRPRQRPGQPVEGVREVGDLGGAVGHEADVALPGGEPLRSAGGLAQGPRHASGREQTDHHRDGQAQHEGHGEPAQQHPGLVARDPHRLDEHHPLLPRQRAALDEDPTVAVEAGPDVAD